MSRYSTHHGISKSLYMIVSKSTHKSTLVTYCGVLLYLIDLARRSIFYFQGS